MITTGDFRNGLTIEFEGELYTIISFQHSKKGRGAAFVRTKLLSLKSGRTKENTFTAGEKVVEARIERHPYQFLYKDEMGYTFMHNETFEQVILNPQMVFNNDLMKDGQNVEIVFHADTNTALSCDLPAFVELVVEYTEPGLKGDTASSNVLKPAKLETGAEIKVPLFVNIGDKIKVDTRDRAYNERVK
jgi:elongation factor P